MTLEPHVSPRILKSDLSDISLLGFMAGRYRLRRVCACCGMLSIWLTTGNVTLAPHTDPVAVTCKLGFMHHQNDKNSTNQRLCIPSESEVILCRCMCYVWIEYMRNAVRRSRITVDPWLCAVSWEHKCIK